LVGVEISMLVFYCERKGGKNVFGGLLIVVKILPKLVKKRVVSAYYHFNTNNLNFLTA
jgi:hypothetical protein